MNTHARTYVITRLNHAPLSSQLHENAVTHKDYFTSRFSALRFFGGMMQAIIFVPIHTQSKHHRPLLPVLKTIILKIPRHVYKNDPEIAM